jgi:X-Pro dipeptidyl-peptidase
MRMVASTQARAKTLAVLAALAVMAAMAPAAHAQTPPVVVESYRVPTVDGAFVSVEVRRPEGAKVPVILTYSPYNVINEPSPTDDSIATRYVPKGYARAVADVLGTRNSSGCWDYGGPKEQQSGVDLVNFLAGQPWSNGKVAMIGGSYDGTTANMVAARSSAAPGLAAIVPVAAISRWYGYAYYAGVRYSGNSQNPADEGFDTPLAFDFGFGRTPPRDPASFPQAAIDRANPCDSVEHTARGYSRTPDYDAFWLDRDYRKDGARFTVPVLLAHGWQDFNVKQEEGTGLYEALKGRRAWTGLYLTQGAHGSPSGDAWEALLDAFFDRFLLGRGDVPAGGVVYSTPRDADGPKDVERLASWPPPATGDVELRLGRGAGGGTLGGTGAGDAATYRDPGTSEEAAAGDPGREGAWLTYRSEPMTGDTRIAGAPALDATVDVDRDHGQLVPTLFDEGPDGALTPITRGFLNLAYRDTWAKGTPMPTGKPVRAAVSLLPQDWIVRTGHRLVLVVASSNTAWAVPDQPGLGVTLAHGGASRLLLPVVGAAPPGARAPVETLPSRREARRRLRVRLAVLRGRRLRAVITAPRGARLAVRLVRGRRATVARRSRLARSGTTRVTFRVRRPGRYRVVVAARTREGRVTARSAPRRLGRAR